MCTKAQLNADQDHRMSLFVIYGTMFAIFLAKALFYAKYVGRFPDEIDHISYIAYLVKSNMVIPDFKSMTILILQSGTGGDTFHGQYIFGTATNQLGHPPLYYQLMRLAHGIVLQNGTVAIHIIRLRLFSLMLASFGLLLAFYIGWTRIRHIPVFHLLYAVICVSVPMFAYVSAGVNNDTMCYVTVTLYLLGFLRYTEKKANVWTYLLISLGITLSVLTKATAAMLVIGSLAFYLLYRAIFHKDWKFFTRRGFAATLPVYLVGILYLLAVKQQTGSFQPTLRSLNLQQYMNSIFYVAPANRQHMDFMTYFSYFFKNFALTWSGISSHVALIKPTPFWSLDQIGLLLLAVLPMLLLFRRKHLSKRDQHQTAVLFIYCTLLMIICIQFIRAYWEFSHVSGYLGGFQSRYYLCAIPMLSLCITWGAESIFSRTFTRWTANGRGQNIQRAVIKGAAIQGICILFSSLLVYEDIIYFLLHFNQYL